MGLTSRATSWMRDSARSCAGLGVRSVLCCNLLEHVTDRPALAASLQDLVAPGSVAVLSVPFRFPYHADPIDTMYRPRPGELAALFPDFTVSAAEIVRCQTWLTYLGTRFLASPLSVVSDVLARRGRTIGRSASARHGESVGVVVPAIRSRVRRHDQHRVSHQHR